MTNTGLTDSATGTFAAGTGGPARRRQVQVRRKPKFAPVVQVAEESESGSEASSRSCAFTLNVNQQERKFTKDGSPEVPTPRDDISVSEWNHFSENPPKPLRVNRTQRSCKPEGAYEMKLLNKISRQSSRCCSVPAALPSLAVYKEYGVYQNDIYAGETDSPDSDNEKGGGGACSSSSLSSPSESGSPKASSPKALLSNLPGSPYDIEVPHSLARTVKRNPMCPFPRRSVSPCPTRFSSVPPPSIVPDVPNFTMEQCPLFNKGKSYNETLNDLSSQKLYKEVLARKLPVQVRKHKKKGSTKQKSQFRGMSAPPASVILTPNDHQLNMDVAAFLGSTANDRGVKLYDLLTTDLLGMDLRKSFEDGAFRKSTEPSAFRMSAEPSQKYGDRAELRQMAITNFSGKKSLIEGLQRVRNLVPAYLNNMKKS